MEQGAFPFTHSENATRFCERILEAMTTICNLSHDESVRMMMEFWRDTADLESDPFIFHEPAYYYAMVIAHHPVIGDNRPEWYADPSLWPPPPGWCFH